MRISSDGTVGIGTSVTAPWLSTMYAIQLGPTGAIYGYDGTIDNTTIASNYYYDNASRAIVDAPGSRISLQSDGKIRFYTFTQPTDFAANSAFASEIKIMTMLNNGNVGIGTDSPGTSLEIAGDFDASSSPSPSNLTSNKGLQIAKETVGNYSTNDLYGIDFSTAQSIGGTNYNIASIYAEVTSIPYYVAGSLHLLTNSGLNGTTLTKRMTILANGKIGMGIVAPYVKLHVYDGASGADPYEPYGLTVENNGRTIIQLLSPAVNDQYLMFGSPVASNRAWISYNHATDVLSLQTAGTISMNEHLTIKSLTGGILRFENTDTSLIGDQYIGGIEFWQNDPSDQGVGLVGKIYSKNISAFSGDASLMFMAGNATTVLTNGMELTNEGHLIVTGEIFGAAKHFVAYNPNDPDDKVIYTSVESKKEDVIFRGTTEKGQMVIDLPQEWTWLVKEDSISGLVNSEGIFVELYIKEYKDNKAYLDIKKSVIGNVLSKFKSYKCSYVIFGERKK